jgi:hypothetical protein
MPGFDRERRTIVRQKYTKPEANLRNLSVAFSEKEKTT